jgi:outer membrane protein
MGRSKPGHSPGKGPASVPEKWESVMSRLFLLGVLLSLALPRAAFAEDLKLGYVDLQRALNETEDGRKAKASLKKVFDAKQKELDEQQEDFKKAKEDLDKKRTLMNADTVRNKEQELAAKFEKVQQSYLRHQKDLQEKEGEVTQKIFERMQRIILKIAQAENFSMVLDKTQAGIIFAKQHLDLTNDVIRRYNSGEGNEGPTAAPAPAKKK